MRLWPPKQTALCLTCGKRLTERKRKPCPLCGDTRRSISRTANESIGSADNVN